MKKPYPTSFSELEKELHIHAQDGRSDALFRMGIVVSQLGSLAAHLTHDTTLNPGCRPYGSRNGEVSDAGHAIVQIITYCMLRDIPIQEAIHAALDNLRDKDFLAIEGGCKKDIIGKSHFFGTIRGTAFVDCSAESLILGPEGSILITKHISTKDLPFLRRFKAVVCDQGGLFSHAAIVCEEMDIPCIVGTGNATREVYNNHSIEIYGDGASARIIQGISNNDKIQSRDNL